MYFLAPPAPTWNKVCEELTPIKPYWYEFGIALGVPQHKLAEFKASVYPLSEVIGYWDAGAIEPEMTWKAVADVLRKIEKPKLAKHIEGKYC